MRLARNRRDRKPAGGGTDQHQAVDLTLLLQGGQSVCGDKGAERKTRQRQSPGRCGIPDHGQHVQQFAAAFVMAALAAAHTPKVKADRRPATLGEGAGQCLHHLVVHGAAKQRMRMGNHGHTFGGGGGLVQGHFDPARLALDREFLCLCVQNQAFVKARLQRPRCGGVSKRSTT